MSLKNMHQYDDIIHLPHPTSKKHPRMPMLDRAAQFSSFAALTGYEDVLEETKEEAVKRLQRMEKNAPWTDDWNC